MPSLENSGLFHDLSAITYCSEKSFMFVSEPSPKVLAIGYRATFPKTNEKLANMASFLDGIGKERCHLHQRKVG